MPRLVHIAAENVSKKIRRNGIAARRWMPDPDRHPEHDRVVWAFPVLPSYTLTHSWARELKRYGTSTLIAVTFQIADNEQVYVCHYSKIPRMMSAADAVGIVLSADDPRGYEIIVPRRINPKEIIHIRVLPRAIGWRYWPTAKGTPMRLCNCPACMPRGEVKAKRYRRRVIKRMLDAGIPPYEE